MHRFPFDCPTELRIALNEWIQQTHDTGRTLEAPAVIEEWVKIMEQQFGTPDWAQLGELTSKKP